MSAVIKVARMQLMNRWTFVGMPLVIMGGVTALAIAIAAIIPVDGPIYVGAGQAALWYFFAVGIQALTLTFPFALAMSVTRRVFFAGTVSVFAFLALAMAVLYFLLSVVESVTGGWGVGGYVYALPWISDGPWYQTILFFWAITLLFFVLGFWGATIYKRWSATGLMVASFGLFAILVGLAGLATASSAWGSVSAFLTTQTPLMISGWLGVVIVLLAGGSFLTLRRALP